MRAWEHRRVAFLLMEKEQKSMQIAMANVLVRVALETPGAPKIYEAPVQASWDNYKHMFPGLFDDMLFYGMLISEHEGEFRGHIDWVRPLDMIAKQEEEAKKTGEKLEPLGIIIETPASKMN